MSIVEVKFSTTDILNVGNESIIKDSLGISDPELQDALNKIAKSAFNEYLKMFTESGVPSRTAEVRELRLFLLLGHYFGNDIPTESELARIFQLTNSQAKTLLKNTMSRYRVFLDIQLKATIKDSLSGTNHRKDGEIHIFTIKSDYIKDAVNESIREHNPAFDRLVNVHGTSGEYKCSEDTYNYLKAEYTL